MRLILVLGCTDTILDGRISVACECYKKGDKILATGTPHEAVYMKSQMANKFSINPNLILMDIQSNTTMDNIFLNREYINTFGTILLVTSQSHVYRSERLLRLVYGGKIETAYSEDEEYYERAKKLIKKTNRRGLV